MDHTCGDYGEGKCKACTAYWLAHGWTLADLEAEDQSERARDKEQREYERTHRWSS